MIHYALRCAYGHDFDGWFASSAAFDRQTDADALCCPSCGTTKVERALMAPAVARGAERPPARDASEHAVADAPEADNARPTPAPREPRPVQRRETPLSGDDEAKLRAAARALRAAVLEHGTNVGRAFPEEARRMHYGESERQGIYGEADAQEVRELIDEGIAVLPLPPAPDDRN